MTSPLTSFAEWRNIEVKVIVKCKKIAAWSRLVWHNFVIVGNNSIKMCNLVCKGTYNRCVKNWLKIPNRSKKMSENCRGGEIFLTHTLVMVLLVLAYCCCCCCRCYSYYYSTPLPPPMTTTHTPTTLLYLLMTVTASGELFFFSQRMQMLIVVCDTIVHHTKNLD